MTREEWNVKWKEAVEESEELKAHEPPFDQKEDWHEWLRKMVFSVHKLSKLETENKKLLQQELEESQVGTLQSCMNRLFGEKP